MKMSDLQKLCMEQGYQQKDVARFLSALELAKGILSTKQRLSGDSSYDHNLRVAEILIATKADPDIVLTGILHSLLRHGKKEEISKAFGKPIVQLLEEVEALKELKIKNDRLGGEAIRKLILTTLKDVRVILVKLANKLDNLYSLDVFPAAEQKRLAEEVLEVYAPLAYRLGVERIRVRLEDRALQILHPKKYGEIQQFLEESREQREKNIEDAIALIKDIARSQVEIVKIKGRPKHIYSIYKKITKRHVPLHEQFDLLGIRVIVPQIRDCYTLLGLLHEKLEPLEGKLKDYIANPKPNFYRSIHTAVKLPNDKIVEIQIRTPEMDEFAEEGLAAHWQYKGVKSDTLFEKRIAWLRGVLDLQKDVETKELLETVKVDLFGDKIYCYTPKGDVKELPKDSTILDFAFLIHEEIGNRTVGARVNGKFVPLKHMLKSGDVVEILTNKNQRPRRSWLRIVTSTKSRQKIRKSLKEHEKLPAIYFRSLKPTVKEEQGVLVHSEEFPKAICVLAKCCQPIPGENIVGIVTKRRFISVHKQDCRQALKEQERWVPVLWKQQFNQKIGFYIIATERSGLLAEILHTIAQAGFEVKEAKAKLLGRDDAECSFLLIPRDLDPLKELVARVMKLKGIKRVYFE